MGPESTGSYNTTWNGLKIVIGGDTALNKWFVKYDKDADPVIHEAWMTANTMMDKYSQPVQLAARGDVSIPYGMESDLESNNFLVIHGGNLHLSMQ